MKRKRDNIWIATYVYRALVIWEKIHLFLGYHEAKVGVLECPSAISGIGLLGFSPRGIWAIGPFSVIDILKAVSGEGKRQICMVGYTTLVQDSPISIVENSSYSVPDSVLPCSCPLAASPLLPHCSFCSLRTT